MSTDVEQTRLRRKAHDLGLIAILLVGVTVFAAIGGALWTAGSRDPSVGDYVRDVLITAWIPAVAAGSVYARSRVLRRRAVTSPDAAGSPRRRRQASRPADG
ncbi:hypothetical protein L5G32_01490 [Gordonia sp. HY002]|uniref:hypothetical protein n=1 Tax=Gordonia zhenghanii TaxID=2911516 RepID=UPI001EF11BE8|nr:hypothetical protein [Gordonia zhenghanii]MCF8568939.1 hypothetical protein [Gordonia zhenghanii]MCF8603034.1 hypothetical protein [Gordonia zhenghanii]